MVLVSHMDAANITSASATSVTFSVTSGFVGTYTLTGTGLTTTVIGGVTYL